MINERDQSLAGDVIAALGLCPGVNANDIRVNVENSRARLTGVVDDLETKTIAGNTALNVDGITSVQNDLVLGTGGTITDLEMERDVRQKLNDSGYAGVGIRVESGTAFLMGVIPNKSTKDTVIDIAREARGVRKVISELEIAAGEPVDNIKLGNDVVEALSDDARLDTRNLSIDADNGEVYLKGQIVGSDQKEIATSVAKSVPGVKKVHNQIEVISDR